MLKKFTFLFAIGILLSHVASSQCATCTPVDCSATKPLGGLCNTMPDDTANQFYDAVISFYMPYKLTDASTLAQCQCNYVNLRHITVTGIQGLPVGMSYTLSNAGGEYDVQTGDTLGCARICGTPIAPGIYPIIVNLLADVTANGTPIGSVSLDDQSQTYKDTIEIFPGTSACPVTFDLGNGCITTSCTEVTTNLTGTLTNTNCPNLISYSWDLGNGQNSNAKNPGAVIYATPDTFPLSLTTTFYTYRVKTVSVSVTGGFSGDIEELTGLQSSDPFIKINAFGFNNRGCGGAGHPCDNNSQTFSNINVVVPDNQCAAPFEIEVWDEDGSIAPTISPDDLINTHTITPSIPNQVGSLLNNSSIGVLFDTVATSSVTETIDIIVYPLPAVPVLVLSADTICSTDSVRISLDSQYDGFAFTWTKDSVAIAATDSVLYVGAGTYTVMVTNLVTGCSETSAPVTVTSVQAAPNTVNVLWNGSQHFVTPFPLSGFAVEWYYNGNLVPGQTGKFLPFYGQGVYEAVVYNTSFTDCRTVANPDTLNNVGIEDVNQGLISDIKVYPNPNNGKFNLAFNTQTTDAVSISVVDLLGREVYNQHLDNFTGDYTGTIDLSNLEKGIYSLWIQSGNIKANQKVVVQ